MISKRQFVMGLLVPLLAVQLACHKKQAAQKPKLAGPVVAPTLSQTLPEEIQAQPVPENPEAVAAKQEPVEPPKKKSRKKPKTSQATAQLPAPQTTAPTTPATTAELHPAPSPADAAAEVAIGPDITTAEAARDRQSTTKLLDTTEKQLEHVKSNNLSSDQQSMLAQIKTYINQSRKAITEGDYERASNLAKKAQLLADELMKQ